MKLIFNSKYKVTILISVTEKLTIISVTQLKPIKTNQFKYMIQLNEYRKFFYQNHQSIVETIKSDNLFENISS